MVGLALAVLSTNLVLGQFGEFLQKAGIETPLPVTEDMLVRTRVVPKDGIFVSHVFARYYLYYARAKVRDLIDLDESVYRIMTRDDPEEMTALSQKLCLIDEEQARQIACEIFEKLGFQDKDFDPPEVHRFTYQPNEVDPRVLLLPWFDVRWGVKGTGKGLFDPCIKMIISGQSKHLVYYSISSLP